MKSANKYWIIGIFLVVLSLFIGFEFLASKMRSYEKADSSTRKRLHYMDIHMLEFVESKGRGPKDIDDYALFREELKAKKSGEEVNMINDEYYGGYYGTEFENNVRLDGWGNELVLEEVQTLNGYKSLRMASMGPNGKMYDDDDIIKWWPAPPSPPDPRYEPPYNVDAGK